MSWLTPVYLGTIQWSRTFSRSAWTLTQIVSFCRNPYYTLARGQHEKAQSPIPQVLRETRDSRNESPWCPCWFLCASHSVCSCCLKPRSHRIRRRNATQDDVRRRAAPCVVLRTGWGHLSLKPDTHYLQRRPVYTARIHGPYICRTHFWHPYGPCLRLLRIGLKTRNVLAESLLSVNLNI